MLQNTTSAFKNPSSVGSGATQIIKVLDRARWAPSGDNAQPWKFELQGQRAVRVHITPPSEQVIYEYGGRPTLIAIGALIETMSIAASQYGWSTAYTYHRKGELSQVDMVFTDCDHTTTDELSEYIEQRTTNRFPYETELLSSDQKQRLEAAIGPNLKVRWREDWRSKWQAIATNMRASKLFFSIHEGMVMREKGVHFDDDYPEKGLPISSVGFSKPISAMIPWASKTWTRTRILNRYLLGWLSASLELDVSRGFNSAALFSMHWTDDKTERTDEEIIGAGRALQRFWLTAEAQGLALQPSYGPIAFSALADDNVRFTKDSWALRDARKLANSIQRVYGTTGDQIAFLGRVGKPIKRSDAPRSWRQPLADLMKDQEDDLHEAMTVYERSA
ncbi:hypothetical protein GCM10007094_31580 [Pseudovibrio japonicus]|uniref:Uncharacterized protein n=1 Tax=Pseudovibrio japonicus TaxID=366534 RepID=A0ABQ3EHR6_9HYPH|nr:hypothetical protein [Pseudovibrio japonicus]GHB39987.1 hypothetical protein GCM10007094_31580 [Pseudovibrio japonicus]